MDIDFYFRAGKCRFPRAFFSAAFLYVWSVGLLSQCCPSSRCLSRFTGGRVVVGALGGPLRTPARHHGVLPSAGRILSGPHLRPRLYLLPRRDFPRGHRTNRWALRRTGYRSYYFNKFIESFRCFSHTLHPFHGNRGRRKAGVLWHSH